MSRTLRLALLTLAAALLLLLSAVLMRPERTLDLPPPPSAPSSLARAPAASAREAASPSARSSAPRAETPPNRRAAHREPVVYPADAASIPLAIAAHRDRIDTCYAMLEQSGQEPLTLLFEGRLEADGERGRIDGVKVFLRDRTPIDPGLTHCFERALDDAEFEAPAEPYLPFYTMLEPP